MKRIEPRDDWPQSWKYSYAYDREEIYGRISNYGYAYAYEKRRQQTLQLVTEAVPRGARVLDIAAAQGNFSLALAELGYEVTWNDLRTELADYVRLKHEHGQIHFAPGNAFDLEFPSLFDAVLITEVIEHVAHPDQFLGKTAALVKPGGHVIMTTPNGAYFKNSLPKFSDCADPSVYESAQFQPDAEGHIFLLHPEEIHRLGESAGLQVDRIRLFTNPLTAGHMKTKALLQVLPRWTIDLIEKGTELLPHFLKRRSLVQMAVRFQKPAAS